MDPDDRDSWLMWDPPPPGAADFFLLWEEHHFTAWCLTMPRPQTPPQQPASLPPPLPPPPRFTRDADGRKLPATVVIRMQADFLGDAQPVLDFLIDRWRGSRGQAFVLTHGEAVGGRLRVQATYTARGANSNDGKKKIVAAAKQTGVALAGGDIKAWRVKDPNASW